MFGCSFVHSTLEIMTMTTSRLNSASKGGAMGTSRFARAQMSACRLSSNSATAGGALFTLSAATSLVFDTRFDNNTASTQGGAFSLQATTASPSVVRCFGCSFRFVDRSISLSWCWCWCWCWSQSDCDSIVVGGVGALAR